MRLLSHVQPLHSAWQLGTLHSPSHALRLTKQRSFLKPLSFSVQYDEHMLKLARNQACGLPLRAGLDGSAAGKVRAGGAGRGREQLSDGMRAALQRKWDEVVAPCTGYPNYDTLRRGVNAELGR